MLDLSNIDIILNYLIPLSLFSPFLKLMHRLDYFAYPYSTDLAGKQ